MAAKYCSKEYAKLRKIVRGRAYRGQAAAKQLIKDVDGLSSKEERLALLQTVVSVGEQGRAKAAKSASWDPSVGWQVAGLGRRNFSAPVVVKSFRPRTMALKRTLCLYSFLKEHGLEGKAPVPMLYKVVEIKKSDDEEAKWQERQQGRWQEEESYEENEAKDDGCADPSRGCTRNCPALVRARRP